ncbi:MAG: (2Fe-2S)-binding protein [Chloroflexota bacterium]|nr:MAG: (2Fe-2S)-binding protein [Chloroflexota bacterium]
MEIRLRLNGQDIALDVAPDETLQHALRWTAGIESARSTCGIGVCGACAVLVDGRVMSSCLILAPLADGRAIETVEALPEDDPVIAAFVAETAFQCSYCTPGFVIAVKALLADDPDPNEATIRERLSGNLCRCGSYDAIVAATQRAARAARRT